MQCPQTGAGSGGPKCQVKVKGSITCTERRFTPSVPWPPETYSNPARAAAEA